MFARACFVVTALAATSLMASGCSEKTDPRTPDEADSSAANQGPRRLALTRDLIESNRLTPDEVAQLQLYLHGTIRLRREIYAEGRQVTPQHTLRIVDGRSYDELVIESGTPGVNIAHDGVRVNFDPQTAQEGLVFDEAADGRYRFKREAGENGHDALVPYDGQDWAFVDGKTAYLEIDAENLHAVLSHERKLPGAKLPPGASSAAPMEPPFSNDPAPSSSSSSSNASSSNASSSNAPSTGTSSGVDPFRARN